MNPLAATASAVLIATGVAMIYLPAGFIAAGIEGLAATYFIAYMHAKGGRKNP